MMTDTLSQTKFAVDASTGRKALGRMAFIVGRNCVLRTSDRRCLTVVDEVVDEVGALRCRVRGSEDDEGVNEEVDEVVDEGDEKDT